MLNLRPYQLDCLHAIHEAQCRGYRRQLVSLPTGSGKTVVFATLIKEMGKKTLVLAHTCELLNQAKEKILMISPGLDVGLLKGDCKEFNATIVVSSIQSAQQPQSLSILRDQGFSLIIVDEAHHSGSESYQAVLTALGAFDSNGPLVVGFTATPFRSDRKGLGKVFEEIVFEKNISEMIEDGYLCPPRGVKVSTELDLKDVAQSHGDYCSRALASVMDTHEMRKMVVEAYLENAEGLQAICFASSVAHAFNLSESFNKAGISSAAVCGETPKEGRARIIEAYKRGEIQVLCNCSVLTEGFDAPETACVIVTRPTRSRGLYQQMVGRGLRKFPGKAECLVIDFNDTTHSLCNAAILLPDAEEAHRKEVERSQRAKTLVADLPTNLNKRLKRAFVSMNLLGDAFNWSRLGQRHFLKAKDGKELLVIPDAGDHYQVIWTGSHALQQVGRGLSFEYAFSTAEDFAREHRGEFILADREAGWRNQPSTDKQQQILRSAGYKAGIEKLTKGQASDLIGSGILRRAS